MTLDFFRIEQHKNLQEKLTSLNISKELLQHLGVDEDFSGFPLDHYGKDNSSVTISPERGTTIPSLVLDGRQIFYNDPERRNNPSQKIRESFRMRPQAGQFEDAQGKELQYNLEQHGFLRDLPREKESDHVSETIFYTFKSTLKTHAQFPYNFNIIQTIGLENDEANINLYLQNISNQPIPSAPGHHTYYKVAPQHKENIELDDVLKVTNEMKKQRINGEKTIVLPNPGKIRTWIPGTGELETKFDSKFKYLRLRSEKDKGFVCIEPVVDHAKNWAQSALLTNPGKIMNIGFSVKLVSKDNG